MMTTTTTTMTRMMTMTMTMMTMRTMSPGDERGAVWPTATTTCRA